MIRNDKYFKIFPAKELEIFVAIFPESKTLIAN